MEAVVIHRVKIMADVFNKKKRSEIMSKIRSKNTGIEKLVFRELRKFGIYFQKHYKKDRGSIDIAFPKKKVAFFIDGDFWHGYQFAKNKKRLPKKYWLAKITRNIERDKEIRAELRKRGWKVLRVWEHEVEKNLSEVMNKIQKLINKQK